MEESIKTESFLDAINHTFECEPADIKQYSPLTLAYIGDAVYDLIVRSVVVERANRSANDLHKQAIRYVNAGAQSALIKALEPDLTEEEQAVFHRGRNARSYTKAKNASTGDYRRATGFEALIGYLYLCGRNERILELLQIGLQRIDLEL